MLAKLPKFTSDFSRFIINPALYPHQPTVIVWKMQWLGKGITEMSPVTKQWNFACYNLNNSVLWQNSNVKMEGNSLFSFTLTRLDCQSCSCFVLLMPQAGQVNKGKVPAADKSWMVLGLRALFNSDSTHLFPEKEQCSNFNGYWRWFWWGVILFVCLFL